MAFEQSFYRDSWVEVNLDAIKQNIKSLQQVLPKEKKIFAVVKANAYGHGDIPVAKTALEAGAYGVAVALLDEALRLRSAGITAPILVLGWVRPDAVTIASEKNITLTVFQKEWMEEAKRHLQNKTLSIHIKVDTGMGRIGLKSKEELQQLLSSTDLNTFQITGIYTHYATADEEDLAYYEKQREQFEEMLPIIKKYAPNALVHADNSAASMRFPTDSYDAVRFGISMYGLYPSPFVKEENPMPLHPAFSLFSQLTHVKTIHQAESISYGRTYQAQEETIVGTVPLGYADGWIRKLQGSDVLVDGKRMPIIGRICMDQFMIKLDKPYPIGTKVTLIGKDGKEEITVDEVAERLETINYEIPCIISTRVPRIYMSDGENVQTVNSVLNENNLFK